MKRRRDPLGRSWPRHRYCPSSIIVCTQPPCWWNIYARGPMVDERGGTIVPNEVADLDGNVRPVWSYVWRIVKVCPRCGAKTTVIVATYGAPPSFAVRRDGQVIRLGPRKTAAA